MPSIPIMCMVCGKSVKDSMFPQHMQSVHGGMSQGEALAAEKNIPNQQTPIVLDKDAPPSPEFMEVAEMLDKPKEAPPVPNTVQKTPARNDFAVQEEPKPIKLEYNYTGNCPKCKKDVKTIIIHTYTKEWFAVALCLEHGQLREEKVPKLETNSPVAFIPFQETSEEEKIEDQAWASLKTKRKGVKHGKRHKSVLRSNATVQTTLRHPRMPNSDKPSIQS